MIPEIFALALAFGGALGIVHVVSSHYRPQLLESLGREEAELEAAFRRIHVDEWTPKSVVYFRFFGAPMAGLGVFLLTQSWVFTVLVTTVLHVMPKALLDFYENQRREKLEAQVVDLINSLVATAKSGMNLQQSLVEVADRLPPPISEECGGIIQRLEAGQALEAALLEADARLGIPNLSLVIQSLVVNEKRGGKLPRLMQRIGESLREIERVEERVKTETSGIKLSSRIMAAMPLVVCFLLYLASPEHVLMLFETTLGNLLLVAALVFDYIGFSMIRKLSELEV